MSIVTYRTISYNLEFQEYHPILWSSFWAHSRFLETYKRITGTDIGFIYIIQNNELTGFMQANGPETIYHSIKNRLTRKWMDKEIKRFNELVFQLKKIIESNRKEFDQNGVEKRLGTVFDLLMQIYPYSNAFYMLSHRLESLLMEKLANYGSEKATAIIVESGTPLKDTFLVQYRKEIESIADDLRKKNIRSIELQALYKNNSAFARKVNAMQKEYFCLTSLNAEERTPESFFPDIAQVMNNPPTKKERIPIPKEVEDDIYLLQAMVYFKDEISTHLIPYIKFGLKAEWNALAEKLKLTREEMDHLLIEEVLGIIPIKNVEKLIMERKKAVFFLHEPPKLTSEVLGGGKAEKEIQLVTSQLSGIKINVTEIKGSTGSPGKAKGIVQKILSSREIAKFKEGNILVTVYTAPDFVPAMKKAIAIITDTGGITSHAAIVSRELGKPCVVGTKIATKALNDGDEVEVDATQGVIRILKKE